jgi:hypothetical protein
MKTFISILIVLSISLLSSCSNPESPVPRAPQVKGSILGDSAPVYSLSTDSTNYSSISEASRIQISGSISQEVQNISDAIQQIRTLVNQHNARIISSESGNTYNKYGNISILVPKESFNELIESIQTIGTKVTNANILSNDVTEEFVDIQAKLNVMNQTENRFITLLSKASTIEDIINVEKELMRLRGEIDSLNGRIQYLSKITDNSVLNVYMIEETPITGIDWVFFDSLDNSIKSLIFFSKHIANFMITLTVFSPIIIAFGLLFFFGNKFGKKFMHRRRK